MMDSNEVLHTWEVPRQITEAQLEEFKKLARKAAPRLLVIITVLLGVLYLFFKTLSPAQFDLNWERLFLGTYLFSIIMITSIFVASPWLMRFSRSVYTISPKGVRWQGSSRAWFYKWSAFESYAITYHEAFPEIRLLILNMRRNKKQLSLPQDDTADKIINTTAGYIAIRVSPDPDPTSTGSTRIKLSKWQSAFLYITTFLYSGVVACFMDNSFMNSTYKEIVPVLPLLMLLLGGGTVGVILLFGKRVFKEKRLIRHMIIFNQLTFCASMFLFVLLAFYRLSKLT